MTDIDSFQFLRATTAKWGEKNPVLLSGELGIEIRPDGSHWVRVGNGISRWSDLDAVVPKAEIAAMIADAVDDLDPGPGGGSSALQAHVDSSTPHPTYDDGPSLLLLYENAKAG